MARQNFFFFLFGPLLKIFAHHCGNTFVLNTRIVIVDIYCDQRPFSFVETPLFVGKSFIQSVSKMLGQTSRMSTSCQNKDSSSYKHMSSNVGVWSVTESLHSTIPTYIKHVIYYLQLT